MHLSTTGPTYRPLEPPTSIAAEFETENISNTCQTERESRLGQGLISIKTEDALGWPRAAILLPFPAERRDQLLS